MVKRYLAAIGVGALVLVPVTSLHAGGQKEQGTVRTAAPIRPEDLPEQQRPKAKTVQGYVPPRTLWGDPHISGAYTNSDESGIPFERLAQFEGKRLED